MSDGTEGLDLSGAAASGEASNKGVAQRRHPRYEFLVPVFVRVLLEEETFSPLRLPGRSCNISSGGMMIEIEGLSQDHYKTMIRRQRMARVHARIPEGGTEVILFGRIVWYDYCASGRGTSCRIGVAFDQLGEKEQEALARTIRQLEAEATGSHEPETTG